MTDRTETTRRGALGAMAAAAAAATGAIPAAAQGGQKTFVLVHGAWHGGWCWRRVADLLEKKGHKVFTPTLTGLGACSHLLSKDINLSTHFTDVANLIEWENLGEVVLVGHSYGGYIVSGAAEKVSGKISSIVFLDAFLPENGESLAAGASQPVKDAIAAALGRGEHSLKPVPAAVFRVNEADRAWVDGKCTPHPIGTLTDKITLTGARDRIAKKSYIRAAGYPSIPFDAVLAKVKSNSAWKTFEMTAGHDAMVDQPQELTDILLQVA
ncbi:MAG: alpha/beta hydrolase [Xanthobacteraceae bacterium]|nr:alpha/beta hydrolase [Xanthobacteraceae bacterium]